MTAKAAFAPEEWKVVLEAPPTAGMIMITAAHGGTASCRRAMEESQVQAFIERTARGLTIEAAFTL